MIGSSKNNRENYPGECFWTQEKEARVKFNPGLSANRPSNNWAQSVFPYVPNFQGIWEMECLSPKTACLSPDLAAVPYLL